MQKRKVNGYPPYIPVTAKIVYQQETAINPDGKSFGRQESYPRN